MNYIPNIISGIRILFIPVFIFFLLNSNYILSLYVFLLMGFSDALDGFIARQFKCESILGSYLDAIADKVMINISFCCLCFIYILPYYLFFLVLLRDICIFLGILRQDKFLKTHKIKPIFISKLNTFLQILLVIVCLLFLNNMVSISLIEDIMHAVILTTFFSLFEYVYSYRLIFQNKTIRYTSNL